MADVCPNASFALEKPWRFYTIEHNFPSKHKDRKMVYTLTEPQ